MVTWLPWWDYKEAACALTTWWRGRGTDAVLGPSQLVLRLSECQHFSPTVLGWGQSVCPGFSGVTDPPYPGALTSCSWPYGCSPLLGEVTQYPGGREPHPPLKLNGHSESLCLLRRRSWFSRAPQPISSVWPAAGEEVRNRCRPSVCRNGSGDIERYKVPRHHYPGTLCGLCKRFTLPNWIHNQDDARSKAHQKKQEFETPYGETWCLFWHAVVFPGS